MEAYTHFTLEERECLAKYKTLGWSNNQIAKKLGRHRSTIGRELARNSSAVTSTKSTSAKGEYLPLSADSKYKRRRKKSVRKLRFVYDGTLISYTRKCLDKYWSPEIIVAKWKEINPNAKLSHTTIYNALERKLIKSYSGFTHLRRRNKQKYVRKDSAVIKPDYTIHDRPPIACARTRTGDWEGDTVLGGKGKGAAVVMADRKSRYYKAALTPNLKADTIKDVAVAMMSDAGLPIETITLDNGPEFARHRMIAECLNTTIYFADPKSPWQRGTVENINDLLRFFYPKGCDFTSITQQELDEVLELINTRPRKCLGWRTSREVFFGECCT